MLKVLISTMSTQGVHPDDFSFVPEGELVARYGLVCASERPDGSGCGCGRAFSGLDCRRSTTTAMVVERDLTEADWRLALFTALDKSGWAELLGPDELAELIDEVVRLDLHAIADAPVGLVLGRLAYNEGRGINASTSDSLVPRGLCGI